MDKVIGVELSHRFAPIAVRERLALNKEQTIAALQGLKKATKKFLLFLHATDYLFTLLEKVTTKF